MDFKTALRKSLRKYNRNTRKHIIIDCVVRHIIQWKGLSLYQNIGSEEVWDEYKDDIGTLYRIGPALYLTKEGTKHLTDCVGLYYS